MVKSEQSEVPTNWENQMCASPSTLHERPLLVVPETAVGKLVSR